MSSCGSDGMGLVSHTQVSWLWPNDSLFRQKLPGMAIVSCSPGLLLFWEFLPLWILRLASAVLITFPLHSAFLGILLLSHVFLLTDLVHLLFPLAFLQSFKSSILRWMTPLFYQTSRFLFSPVTHLSQPLPGGCDFKHFCSLFQLLPHGSISMLGLILQETRFFGGNFWVIEDGPITVLVEAMASMHRKPECFLLSSFCSS